MQKLIFLFGRKEGVSRPEFVSHYIDVHSPLGLRLTRNLDGYTVNFVQPDGGPDAVTEIWTPLGADFLDPTKCYARPEDADAVSADHNSFIGPMDIYLVDEQVVRGEPLDTPLHEPTPEGKLVWLYRDGESIPEPPPGARRVVENRVLQKVLSDAPSDLALIRMAWSSDPDGIDGAAALPVREYRRRVAVV